MSYNQLYLYFLIDCVSEGCWMNNLNSSNKSNIRLNVQTILKWYNKKKLMVRVFANGPGDLG